LIRVDSRPFEEEGDRKRKRGKKGDWARVKNLGATKFEKGRLEVASTKRTARGLPPHPFSAG